MSAVARIGAALVVALLLIYPTVLLHRSSWRYASLVVSFIAGAISYTACFYLAEAIRNHRRDR